MKKIIFVVLAIIGVSCSSNDTDPSETKKKLYVSKIVNTSSKSSVELRFTYDSKNRLIRNETDTYFREFVYDGENRVIQIKSITKPNTPYYTVSFVYDRTGKVIEVKRDNHYNGSIFYTKYDYYSTGEVSNIYVFSLKESYLNNRHDRYYSTSGYGLGKNYKGKLLSVYKPSIDTYDPVQDEEWSYDVKKRPYFGEALSKIFLPYATDGTGLDWDLMYQTNNPVKFSLFSFSTGKSFIRKTYEYEYNVEEMPTKMIKKTFNSDGSLSTTFTQDFIYSLR